ncbi:hypothetical protein J2129_000129 [Methanofollis sp. W23]|nr:hypothetical protein [Methanofollis sp. W23]
MMLDSDSLPVCKDEGQELIKFDMKFLSRILGAGARFMVNSTEPFLEDHQGCLPAPSSFLGCGRHSPSYDGGGRHVDQGCTPQSLNLQCHLVPGGRAPRNPPRREERRGRQCSGLSICCPAPEGEYGFCPIQRPRSFSLPRVSTQGSCRIRLCRNRLDGSFRRGACRPPNPPRNDRRWTAILSSWSILCLPGSMVVLGVRGQSPRRDCVGRRLSHSCTERK